MVSRLQSAKETEVRCKSQIAAGCNISKLTPKENKIFNLEIVFIYKIDILLHVIKKLVLWHENS